MTDHDEQVRLPELPIFKKYSLALRREFAGPKEILSALERTMVKVQSQIKQAEARRQEPVAGDAEPPPDGIDDAEPRLDGELFEGASPSASVLEALEQIEEFSPEMEETPIWEPEPEPEPVRTSKPRRARTPKAPEKRVKRRGRPRPRPAVRKPNRDSKPEIVRVSSKGTPIRAPIRTAIRRKSAAKSKPRSGSGRRAGGAPRR